MRIRNLEQKDAELMLEWMHDAEIASQFRKEMQKLTIEDARSYIAGCVNDNANVHFAIVDDADEYLGTVSLKNINRQDQNAEYAICLRRKAMGTGAAKFATEQIISYGFNTLKLARIYLNVLSENKRAVRFYEKFGFCYEGEFKKHFCIRGELKDVKWFAIMNQA